MTNQLPRRTLGRTGLEVTQLGYGTALPELSEGEHGDMFAGELLNAVLDSGINFIDSAPDYGRSEERIGKFISHRRDEYFLATKCGCNIDAAGVRGEPGHLWSAARLRANIDQSLGAPENGPGWICCRCTTRPSRTWRKADWCRFWRR